MAIVYPVQANKMTQPNNATTPSERKFVCQPCDKRYSCLSHLNRHKTESREHKERIRQMKRSNPKETDTAKDKSDQKLSCQPCGKSFDYAWQLNSHKESRNHSESCQGPDHYEEGALRGRGGGGSERALLSLHV